MELSREMRGAWEHYKGKLYFVEGVAIKSGDEEKGEQAEKFVVYRPLYGDFDLRIRPMSEFLELLEEQGTPPVRRFRYRMVRRA